MDFNIILACSCNHHGSKDDMCDRITGQCNCKDGYTAKICDECATGYKGFPNCEKGWVDWAQDYANNWVG